jgi:tetratricopeptide (TPR) repeat protein
MKWKVIAIIILSAISVLAVSAYYYSYKTRGSSGDAVAVGENAVSASSEDMVVHLKERGKLLLEKGRTEALIAVYSKMVQGGNEQAKRQLAAVRLRLAEIEDKLGNKALAEKNYKLAIELDPSLKQKPPSHE